MTALVSQNSLWALLAVLLCVLIAFLAVLSRRSTRSGRAHHRLAPAKAEPESEPAAAAAGVPTPEPVAKHRLVPEPEPEMLEAEPLETAAPPESETQARIKGNEASMLFHTEESPYFARTRADVWFDTEESARAAGFQRWNARDEDVANPPTAQLPRAQETPRHDLASDESAFGPGSADPLDDGTAPDGFTVKATSGSMLFHTRESPYYARIRAEIWFSSEEAARAAGFARWDDD